MEMVEYGWLDALAFGLFIIIYLLFGQRDQDVEYFEKHPNEIPFNNFIDDDENEY